jgi:uncharacterized repeat protein (TIGR03803 family)
MLASEGNYMRQTIMCLVLLVGFSYFASYAQTYKVLWTFNGYDGNSPVGTLIMDKAGNLYGVTEIGGTMNSVCPNGCGVVYKLVPGGTETVLHRFCSNLKIGLCTDGAFPLSGLVMDASGNLYGTTMEGGSSGDCSGGCGVAFELSPPSQPRGGWTETVLHSFCSQYNGTQCIDGVWPYDRLVFDAAGDLYGTTHWGGTGRNKGGTVFELSPGAHGWVETVLYNFCSRGTGSECPDGTTPIAGVTFDADGSLYGATQALYQSVGNSGVVFKLSRSKQGWREQVLTTFAQTGTGIQQLWGDVMLDHDGNLYGSAFQGGLNNYGGLFELSKKENSKRVLKFSGSEGAEPANDLLIDPQGRGLISTAQSGGGAGGGTLFQITPQGDFIVLYSFNPFLGDFSPSGGVVEDAQGNMYGVLSNGEFNTESAGSVYEFIP